MMNTHAIIFMHVRKQYRFHCNVATLSFHGTYIKLLESQNLIFILWEYYIIYDCNLV